MDIVNPVRYDREWTVKFTLSLANTPPGDLNGGWFVRQYGIKPGRYLDSDGKTYTITPKGYQRIVRSSEKYGVSASDLRAVHFKIRKALDGVINGEVNEAREYLNELHPSSNLKKRYVPWKFFKSLHPTSKLTKAQATGRSWPMIDGLKLVELLQKESEPALTCAIGLRGIEEIQLRAGDAGTKRLKKCTYPCCSAFHYGKGEFHHRNCKEKHERWLAAKETKKHLCPAYRHMRKLLR